MISQNTIPSGYLRKVHHIAFNVRNMDASRHFYGHILGLHELTGDEIPTTLIELVKAGKVANFITPDGTVIDLFGEPQLLPPDPDPSKSFTRAYHLAFDIDPELFDQALAVIQNNNLVIAYGPFPVPLVEECTFMTLMGL